MKNLPVLISMTLAFLAIAILSRYISDTFVSGWIAQFISLIIAAPIVARLHGVKVPDETPKV